MKILLKYACILSMLLASTGAIAQVKANSDLHKIILAMDKAYFSAYNTCDLETQANLLSSDLEFYHDQGGLSTSKEEIIQSIESNICGKVSRELIEESVEIHQIKGFGAVEIGLHKFYNNQEPETESKPSRFITVWKQENDTWKMHRIVSLH